MALAVDGRTTRISAAELLNRERPDLVHLEALKACSMLEVLELSGLCPKLENLTALTKCSKLAVIDISGTSVTTLAALRGCPRLHTLAVKFTPSLSSVSHLVNLVELRELDLAFTSVADVTPLGTLSRLASLSLQGTKVVSAAPLASCGQLAYLCLHGALSLADIHGLERCTALTALDIRKGWELNDWDDEDALCPLPAALHSQFDVRELVSGLYRLRPRSHAGVGAAAGAPPGAVPALDIWRIGRVATSDGGSVPYSPRVFSASVRGTKSPRA